MYGLAADPFRTGASDRLFAVKRRPRTVELPVLVADVEQALSLAIAVPAAALRLMERCWPGPLTIVLPRRPDLNADLGTDDATIGIRCPRHPVPLALCRAVGPLATTSANRHRRAARHDRRRSWTRCSVPVSSSSSTAVFVTTCHRRSSTARAPNRDRCGRAG